MSTTPPTFCARTAVLSALSDLLQLDTASLQARLEAGDDLATMLADGGVGLEALSSALEQRLAPGITA